MLDAKMKEIETLMTNFSNLQIENTANATNLANVNEQI